MGNFVHDILETLYRTAKHERTLDTARLIAGQVWNEYEEKVSPVLRGKKDAIRMFRWNSWWCVENLFEMENPQLQEFDGLEHELNHTLFQDSDTPVSIKGFVDRWHLDGEQIVIGDYKTGKIPGTAYQRDKFDQLLVYAHVLREQMQKDVKEVQLLYIKGGETLRMQPTDDDFEAVKEDLICARMDIDARCKSGYFEPKPSRLCDWCSFKSICPIFTKGKYS